jgi:hypothetical protein
METYGRVESVAAKRPRDGKCLNVARKARVAVKIRWGEDWGREVVSAAFWVVENDPGRRRR